MFIQLHTKTDFKLFIFNYYLNNNKLTDLTHTKYRVINNYYTTIFKIIRAVLFATHYLTPIEYFKWITIHYSPGDLNQHFK